MQLGRYSVSTLRPATIHSIRFTTDGRYFAVASESGYEIWRTWPLALLKRRTLPGTLALALPLPASPLLVLQGGGANPLYPPNKAVIYNDQIGLAVAELEFGERIRGIVARQGLICIALSRRVVAFEHGMKGSTLSKSAHHIGNGKGKQESGKGFWLSKYGEWETALNETGLIAMATAPGSTLLALPGRQPGHVQMIPLPPSPGGAQPSVSRPSSFRTPIILAHTHPLSTLTCSSNGSHIITTSDRGTLLRVWETSRGHLEQELRRGVDRAEMWGASFENSFHLPTDGVAGKGQIVGWSDKGTVHVWGGDSASKSTSTSGGPSLGRILSQNLPLPKYFSSTASAVQYHLPQKNPHAFASTVGAVAGKAGVHSRKLEEDDGEWTERFVVGWVDVEVEDTISDESAPLSQPRDMGSRSTAMGSRGERRSFGSETNSSRTATPTFRSKGGIETPPVVPIYHRSSLSTADTMSTKRASGLVGVKPNVDVRAHPVRINSGSKRESGGRREGSGTGRVKVERQLVAITFAGDWYRLRIPDGVGTAAGGSGEGAEERKRKCELVEYRRLGVGGGGW